MKIWPVIIFILNASISLLASEQEGETDLFKVRPYSKQVSKIDEFNLKYLKDELSEICKSDSNLPLDENYILKRFEYFAKTLGDQVMYNEISKYLEGEKIGWKTKLFLYDFIGKDEKFAQENYEKLSAAYCKMMFHYFQKYRKDKSDTFNYEESVTPLLNILPKSYQFKGEKTQKHMDHILKKLNGFQLNSGTLQVLAALAQIDMDVYDQAKEKIFDNRIDIIVDYFLNHPLEIEKFTNTTLSFDNILTTIVTKLAQPSGKDQPKKSYRYQKAFSTFLIGGEIYFERFENLLADNIYDILIFNSSSSPFDVFDLFKSSSKTFHEKVFDALIRFIAVQDTPLNQLMKLPFIDKLFGQSTPCLSQQPSEFYDNIYTVLNKNNACYALQKLWLFMDQHTDHKNYFDLKSTLYLQILGYFNQTLLHDMKHYQNMPFNKFINEVLSKVLHEQKIPLTKIHEFIEVGKKTKFSNYFNPEIIYSLDGLMAQDDASSLKDRSTAFTSQFIAHINENTLHIFRDRFNTSFLSQPFKQFADLHFKAFEKDLPYYKYFALMRQMIELKNKYPDLRPLSNMTKLYNAYDQESKLEKFSLGLKVLERNFLDPLADHHGNLYGFVHVAEGECLSQDPASFFLYACDGKTGYANWKIDINLKSGIKRPFKAIFEDTLYLLWENDDILRINIKTGQFLDSIQINYLDFPLIYMESASNDTLFLVYNNEKTKTAPRLLGLNLKTLKQNFSRDLPTHLKVNPFYEAVDHYLVSGNSRSLGKLYIYNSVGQEIIISGEADEAVECKHDPQWNILKRHLFFDQRIQEDTYNIVCHNLMSNREEWRFDFKGGLAIKPTFSSIQDTAFFLSNFYQLTAVGLSQNNKGQQLWSLKMGNSINEIRGSGSGRYIYGVNRTLNKFIKVDTATREKENLGAFAIYEEQKIVDTSADVDFLKQPF